MYITWSTLIKILEKMFPEITTNTIADKLELKASTITRLKSGELGRSTELNPDNVYAKLLEPTQASKIMRMKMGEKELLSLLKDAIEEACAQDFMSDLWKEDNDYQNGDYTAFVRKMMDQIISNHADITIHSVDNDNPVDDYVMEKREFAHYIKHDESVGAWICELSDPNSETNRTDEDVAKIRNVFHQTITKYNIVNYLESTDGIFDDILSSDINSFQKSIERRILKRPASSISEKSIVDKIARFSWQLEHYFASPKLSFSVYTNFKEETDKLFDELISLLYEIYGIERSSKSTTSD